MDSTSVAQIDALLDRVVAEHHVFLPLAIESGSRAWGFPSPDSDYDCRFVFVRRICQHVTLISHLHEVSALIEAAAIAP